MGMAGRRAREDRLLGKSPSHRPFRPAPYRPRGRGFRGVQNIITTENDLRSYIEQQLSCHDWNAVVLTQIHEQLMSEDHPYFGDDGAAWLDGIKVKAPWEWLELNRQIAVAEEAGLL